MKSASPIVNYVEPFFGSGAVWFGAPWWGFPAKPLFSYFGGKSRVAEVVWQAFGAPDEAPTCSVNDKDGFLANAWRAVKHAPEEVAKWCGGPVIEADLHAMHFYLKERRGSLNDRLAGDIDHYDARMAGYWIKGACEWIGSGWCGENDGPWYSVPDAEGVRRMVKIENNPLGDGVRRKLPHLGTAGAGVNRQLPHLGAGKGVNRKLPHLGDAGKGVNSCHGGLVDMLSVFTERLANVRVCNGEWHRVCGSSVTFRHGLTGVFLDPPYSAEAGRDMTLYSQDCGKVAHEVRTWCLANGANPLLRLALCGYDGEHNELEAHGWRRHEWKANGGYGSQGDGAGRANAVREVIWFSPHCIAPETPGLLSLMEGLA